MNKKWIALALTALLAVSACAEGANPPAKPDGKEMPQGMEQPPEKPDGEMGQPPEMPEGGFGDMPMGGAPMGGAQQPESYTAVLTIAEDANFTGAYDSQGKDENAILVTSGSAALTDATVTRTSAESTGGDNASFYGVGAAILATGGELTVQNTTIDTDAAGGAGIFAYGDGVVTVENSVITTKQGTSGGIHVAGGGTLYAKDLTVMTEGASSPVTRPCSSIAPITWSTCSMQATASSPKRSMTAQKRCFCMSVKSSLTALIPIGASASCTKRKAVLRKHSAHSKERLRSQSRTTTTSKRCSNAKSRFCAAWEGPFRPCAQQTS